jgi:hypothetical protein
MLVDQSEGRSFVLILVTREFHSNRLSFKFNFEEACGGHRREWRRLELAFELGLGRLLYGRVAFR